MHCGITIIVVIYRIVIIIIIIRPIIHSMYYSKWSNVRIFAHLPFASYLIAK